MDQPKQAAPQVDQSTDTLRAIFSVGLKLLRPQITERKHSSAKAGSYLQIKQRGQSFKVPILDNSAVRTSVNKFR